MHEQQQDEASVDGPSPERRRGTATGCLRGTTRGLVRLVGWRGSPWYAGSIAATNVTFPRDYSRFGDGHRGRRQIGSGG